MPTPRLLARSLAAGAAVALAVGTAGVAAAEPVQVFQQPAKAVGMSPVQTPVPLPVPLSVPTVVVYELRAEQTEPGRVRLWIEGSDQPCLSPADRVVVEWGNFETGETGRQAVAACAQSTAPRDAVVDTGAGGINVETVAAGPQQLALGSAGLVGDPGMPYLNGNGAFTVE